MSRMQELFDKPIPFEWADDSSVEDISTATFFIHLQGAVVADLSPNALDDMRKLDPHNRAWTKKRKDPMLLPINAVAIEVEFQNLNVSDMETVFEIDFGAHIFVPVAEIPFPAQGDGDYFHLGYTMAATDLGNAVQTFSTIRAILEDFIVQNQDRVGGFAFAGKGESRQKLYRVLTSKLAKQYSFHVIDAIEDLDDIEDLPQETWLFRAYDAIASQIDELESLEDADKEVEWFILLRSDLMER